MKTAGAKVGDDRNPAIAPQILQLHQPGCSSLFVALVLYLSCIRPRQVQRSMSALLSAMSRPSRSSESGCFCFSGASLSLLGQSTGTRWSVSIFECKLYMLRSGCSRAQTSRADSPPDRLSRLLSMCVRFALELPGAGYALCCVYMAATNVRMRAIAAEARTRRHREKRH